MIEFEDIDFIQDVNIIVVVFSVKMEIQLMDEVAKWATMKSN